MGEIKPRTGPITPREASRIYSLCVAIDRAGGDADEDDPQIQDAILRWMRLLWAEWRREAATRAQAQKWATLHGRPVPLHVDGLGDIDIVTGEPPDIIAGDDFDQGEDGAPKK